MHLENHVAKLLMAQAKTIAIAESCTGGLLTNRLTNIPGSSKFLKFTIVPYSNESKMKLLKIPSRTISRYGAVSEQTAMAMAQGVRKILKTDLGIAITGIAGPSGGSKNKPVGLTYTAVASDQRIICIKKIFQGSRLSIKQQALTHALRLLLKVLTPSM